MVYAGKVVLVGKDNKGREFIAYRITSASMPSRELKVIPKEDIVKVFPGGKSDNPKDTYMYDWMHNPPYSDPYTCLRKSKNESGEIAYFASNGNQTNRVNTLFERGLEGRSSILETMFTYNNERSDVARIFAGIDKASKDQEKILGCGKRATVGLLGVITPISAELKLYKLREGRLFFVGSTPETWKLETTLDFKESFSKAQDLARFLAVDERFSDYNFDRKGNKLKVFVATALNTGKESYDLGVYNSKS